MKLYSRKQLIGGIALGVFAALLLIASGMGLLALWNARNVAVVESSVSVDSLDTLAVLQDASTQGAAEAIVETAATRIYETYNESVVNITTEIVGVNWFLDPVPQSGGSGSGTIIDSRGYVLTNYHVIKDAYKLFVNTADGGQHEARVLGSDPQNDLAIIAFNPPATLVLKPIPFGTSRNLKVGQTVYAIGNPFGLERTLTQGIVSGLGRPIQKDDTTVLQNMIQTDASINPGNSGGPLFNSKGEMIGINTMIYSPSGGSVGIGFAIPVDTAIRIVPELVRQGHILRGWVDMEAIQLFPTLVTYLKQQGMGAPVDKGLLVSSVPAGSNAAKAGLKGGQTTVRYGRSTFNIGGDIIVSIDGYVVISIADLYTALEDNKPGQSVVVEYYRDGKKSKVTVVLAERKDQE